MTTTHPFRRRALLAGLAGGLAAPRIASGQAAITLTDAIGREVRLARPPERIIPCFNFEEFTAVAGPAGWERVVAFPRSWWSGNRAAAFARYRAAIPRLMAVPDTGNNETGNFSLETVLSVSPDLVIIPEVWRAALRHVTDRLDQVGVPWIVIDYNAQEPARHVASTLALGEATGNAARAQELAELYTGRIAEIRGRLAGVTRRPKVYVELGQGGAGVIGNSYWTGMWGRIVELIGAENIAAGRIAGAWGPLNPEYVLAADPDVIVIAGSSWANRPDAVVTGFDATLELTRARLAPYTRRQGWAGLTAIRNGELHAIEHGLCRSLFDYTAITYLARALYPERCGDYDPVADLRAYHARYLPVAFEGVWMARFA